MSELPNPLMFDARCESTKRRIHLTSTGDCWLGVVVAIMVATVVLSFTH